MIRRVLTSIVSTLALGLGVPTSAPAACLLANPSFEIGADDATVFGGWNEFGTVEAASEATHGRRSARIVGPRTGGWDVAGVWQPLDSAPGDRWTVSTMVRADTTAPLEGGSRAIVNVEWRDGASGLIDYVSFTALDPADPGSPVHRVFTTPEAPSGTATVRVLLGVLQDPSTSSGAAFFDQVRFEKQTAPSIEELQWADFPGGRTLDFAGRRWRVKGPGVYGPGPNAFCDDPECVDVGADGRLRLTLAERDGVWQSTEVALEEFLGYGDYVFTVRGPVHTLDPHAVLGLFLWEYGPCWDPAALWWNPFNEIDVEFSRWGIPGDPVAQFVVQPYDWPGNRSRFDPVFGEDELSSHAFRWTHDRVEFRSWRGGPNDESPATRIHEFVYTGPHLPRPDRPRVHMNLWRFQGDPAAPQQVVVEDFTFRPACADPPCDGTATAAPPAARDLRITAHPNPFNGTTRITYVMPQGGWASISVFDAAGRRVTELYSGIAREGENTIDWKARDEAGQRVASGVYFVQLSFEGGRSTVGVVLLE